MAVDGCLVCRTCGDLFFYFLFFRGLKLICLAFRLAFRDMLYVIVVRCIRFIVQNANLLLVLSFVYCVSFISDETQSYLMPISLDLNTKQTRQVDN